MKTFPIRQYGFAVLGILLLVTGCQRNPQEVTRIAASTQPAAPARADRIGTYDSRMIAVAFASSRYNTIVADLNKELKAAETAGDTQRIAEIKARGQAHQDLAHRQAFGRAPVDDLLLPVKDRIPQVMAEAGVDQIQSKYALDPGAEAQTVDVTDALVQLYDPSEKVLGWIRDLKNTEPYSDEEIARHSDH